MFNRPSNRLPTRNQHNHLLHIKIEEEETEVSEEKKFRKLEGTFQYELLLAIRDARKLYINSRIDPSLVPPFYDSVKAIYYMIMPFLKEEDRNIVRGVLNESVLKPDSSSTPLSKSATYRSKLRGKARMLFEKAIELCAKERLIVTEIVGEF